MYSFNLNIKFQVYFLELRNDKWLWSKPIVHRGSPTNRPIARTEHSATKIDTNEIAIFGGWTGRPASDLWIFNYVDMVWVEPVISGIRPKGRFRHTSEIIGKTLYILGGSDNIDDIADGCRNLNIHALDLNNMEWSHPEIR